MKDSKHTSGFGTPKGYFEEFEDRLFSKISEDQIPNESGFKVPEGYFDLLENKVLAQIDDLNRSRKVIPLFTRKTLVYAASIAACAVLVFSLINTENPIYSIDDIEISTIENYIDQGLLGFDSNDLTALLMDEDITGLLSENDLLNDELLEDYLLKNIDDTTLLTE